MEKRTMPETLLLDAERMFVVRQAVVQLILALGSSGSTLAWIERAVVRFALKVAQGNQSAAARLIGMDRKAFVRRMQRGALTEMRQRGRSVRSDNVGDG
jgi:DNA-binding NtrC family response regulator